MIRRPMTVCGGASVFAKYVDVRHTVRANAETGDDQRMGEVVHRIEGNTVRLGGSAVVDQQAHRDDRKEEEQLGDEWNVTNLWFARSFVLEKNFPKLEESAIRGNGHSTL